MPVLTDDDHKFFADNGYVIVRQAVPRENCDAAIDAIFEYLGIERDDPDDWYRLPHGRNRSMLDLIQAQAMWDNRQHPRVHQAFAEMWGTPKLRTSIDRISFKPPPRTDHPDWHYAGGLHWDYHMKSFPIAFSLQGVLYLSDTGADQGGFHCVPGVHKQLIEPLGAGQEYVVPDLDKMNPTPIVANAGDLVIWHRALPHGSGINRSTQPRFAQYICMGPVCDDEHSRNDIVMAIAAWQQVCGGDVVETDPQRAALRSAMHGQQPAKLTALGRKLMGLDSWATETDSPPASA